MDKSDQKDIAQMDHIMILSEVKTANPISLIYWVGWLVCQPPPVTNSGVTRRFTIDVIGTETRKPWTYVTLAI